MAEPYTSRVLAGVASSSATLSYTVPAGKRAVLVDIYVNNNAATATSVSVVVAGMFYAYRNLSLAASSSDHWSGRQVANAGETVTVNSASAGVTVGVTAYILDLLPPA